MTLRQISVRVAAAVLFAAAWSCAHGIRNVSDCGEAPVEQRVACAACAVQNDAGGVLGSYEYKPGNSPSDRCVKKN